MPEIAEIESLVRFLCSRVTGKTVKEITCRQPKMLNLEPEELSARAAGKVRGAERRAKYAVIHLERGDLWLHLGLTASTGYEDAPATGDAHTLSIRFDDGSVFCVDKTFMGSAHFLPEAESQKRMAELGHEPLDPHFDTDCLVRILSSRPKSMLKAILMDQSTIAGIGNFYSDEILHRAHLHPATPAGTLGPQQAAALHDAIRSVISEAISQGGDESWTDPGNHRGEYTARVHNRTECAECGGPVQKIPLQGRSAYVCPQCQN